MGKRTRVVMLKPNKDPDFRSQRFKYGRHMPLIDGPYPLTALRDAFRPLEGASQGNIVISLE